MHRQLSILQHLPKIKTFQIICGRQSELVATYTRESQMKTLKINTQLY